MDITSIGASALNAASQAAAVRANNIVNADTPDFTPKQPVFSPLVTGGVAVFTQTAEQPVNIIGETIGLIQASNQYKAAAAIVRTGEELSSTFLQTIA